MRNTKISLDESDLRQIQHYAESNPSLELTNPMKNSQNYSLTLVQQPLTGKAVSSNLRARGMKWPVEPPPVLELSSPEKEPQKWLYIHNPNWFCVADIISIEATKRTNNKKENKEGSKDNLSGLLASSLHKVKNPEDRNEHGYFVFGDLNVRDPGRYKLEFTLFEMRRYDTHVYAAKVDSVVSNEFEVYKVHPPKTTIPAKDSTKLSKVLSESGVKIRLRKESTKRKQANFNWSSTATENFNYGPNRTHPATLAPLNLPSQMGPPPLIPGARVSRNNGEDITRRTSIIQNEMNVLGGSQRQMTSPTHHQHQGGGQGHHFGVPGGVPEAVQDYTLQHGLSPLSRGSAHFQQTSPGQLQFQFMQPPPQTQQWNFTGQGVFHPESMQVQQQYFQAQPLPEPREDDPRYEERYPPGSIQYNPRVTDIW